MKTLLKKLVETAGPPGYEHSIRSLIRDEIKTLVDDLRIDNLGNLIARKGARAENGLRIMLAAHMDEIGLIVTHIDEKGFVRFAPLGGLHRLNLPGNRVRFLNGALGVVGSERLADEYSIPAFEQMFVDLGVSSRADCPVRVGDLAVMDRAFEEMGNRLVGKAMDDRAGVALLIQVLRQMSEQQQFPPHELYFVFSAQEEIGARGATVAAYEIDPDLGLSIDLTASAGTPKGIKSSVELGCGPAIKVRDQWMLSDPRIVNWMRMSAEKANLPYQLEILENGSTEARAIQLARSGVPVGGLSIPARYIHSPSEMVDLNDLQNSAALILELLNNPVNLK